MVGELVTRLCSSLLASATCPAACKRCPLWDNMDARCSRYSCNHYALMSLADRSHLMPAAALLLWLTLPSPTLHSPSPSSPPPPQKTVGNSATQLVTLLLCVRLPPASAHRCTCTHLDLDLPPSLPQFTRHQLLAGMLITRRHPILHTFAITPDSVHAS